MRAGLINWRKCPNRYRTPRVRRWIPLRREVAYRSHCGTFQIRSGDLAGIRFKEQASHQRRFRSKPPPGSPEIHRTRPSSHLSLLAFGTSGSSQSHSWLVWAIAPDNRAISRLTVVLLTPQRFRREIWSRMLEAVRGSSSHGRKTPRGGGVRVLPVRVQLPSQLTAAENMRG